MQLGYQLESATFKLGQENREFAFVRQRGILMDVWANAAVLADIANAAQSGRHPVQGERGHGRGCLSL